MSFLKKALAGIGIGGIKVDAILSQREFMPGQTVSGVVNVAGGNVPQNVESIDLDLMTSYLRKRDDVTYRETVRLARAPIQSRFTLQPGQTQQFPFQLHVPLQAPLTLGGFEVYVRSEVNVQNAVDPSDKDPIGVSPTPIHNMVFQAMQSLGFQLYRSDCEEARFGGLAFPFAQEFEFRAMGGPFAGQTDEVELVFALQPDALRVYVVVDRRVRGWSSFMEEMAGFDDRRFVLDFPLTAVSQGPAVFAQALHQTIASGLR